MNIKKKVHKEINHNKYIQCFHKTSVKENEPYLFPWKIKGKQETKTK